MITGEVRGAIRQAADAAGFRAADPGLRPTGKPGQYASSIAFALGGDPRAAAGRLAERVRDEPWIAVAEVTGPGFLTITVTPEALTALAERIIAAGPACAAGDALRGQAVPAPRQEDPLAAATWEKARAALAAQLTARLAAAAGATVAQHGHAERMRPSPHAPVPLPADEPRRQDTGQDTEVARAVAFAGPDAVLFSLARALPGQPVEIDPGKIASHVLDNPAYAVRYAHARAASGLRWAASRETVTLGTEAVPWCPPADPGELALLDALSWLPERVAIAARRGRPDEFARYLEELARAVLAVLPGNDRLALAAAAQAGLAAGLGLIGVSAPDRL